MARGHVCLTPAALKKAKAGFFLTTHRWTRAQEKLFAAVQDHRIVVYAGGNGAGKSHVGGGVCVGACQGQFQNWCPVPADVAFVGLGYGQVRDAMQPKLRQMIAPELVHHRTTRDGLTATVDFCNGSHLSVLTCEQGPDMHQGARRSVILYDEEPAEPIFQEGIFRIRTDMSSRNIFTMTPTHGEESWVNQKLLKFREERDCVLVEATQFECGFAPCEMCGMNPDQWDHTLKVLHVERGSPSWLAAQVQAMLGRTHDVPQGFCGRCWTYGCTPLYDFEQQRSSLTNTNARDVSMRFLGKFCQLQGGDCFTPAQKRALREYAAAQKPIRVEACQRTYHDPLPGHRYTMGVDGARGHQGDESVFVCLDGDTGHVVSIWGDDETMWDEMLPDLIETSQRYYRALTWVEWASAGEGILPMLMRLPTMRLYGMRQADRRYQDVVGTKVGFHTNQRSRNRLLMQYVAAITESFEDQPDGSVKVAPGKPHALYLTDPKTVDQTCALFYDDQKDQKIKVSGGHDDRIMATAGAWEAWVSLGTVGQAPKGIILRAPRPSWRAMFPTPRPESKTAQRWRARIGATR